MKRYFLFGFDQFYPSGGMGDFMGHYESFNEVYEHIKSLEYYPDHFELLDTENGKIYNYDEFEMSFVESERVILT